MSAALAGKIFHQADSIGYQTDVTRDVTGTNVTDTQPMVIHASHGIQQLQKRTCLICDWPHHLGSSKVALQAFKLEFESLSKWSQL